MIYKPESGSYFDIAYREWLNEPEAESLEKYVSVWLQGFILEARALLRGQWNNDAQLADFVADAQRIIDSRVPSSDGATNQVQEVVILSDRDLLLFGARELDARSNDGLEVRLLWSPVSNDVLVAVDDTKTDQHFTLDTVPRDRALDAFRHPYAYA